MPFDARPCPNRFSVPYAVRRPAVPQARPSEGAPACSSGRVVGVSAPFGGMPTRWDPESGPSTRVAVVVPGAGYSPAHPLLEFGRQALLQHDWTVQQIWWDQPNGLSDDEQAAWVCDQVRTTLHAETGAERALLLAKSLGTLAAPVAADNGLDAIWMTPLFDDETSIDAIARNAARGARQLLVGGLADPSWDPARARRLGCEVVDFPETTHFMHVPGNAVRTAKIHLDVTRVVDRFLTDLDSGPDSSLDSARRGSRWGGEEGGHLRNFGYLLDGRLAGLAHPGFGGHLDAALQELRGRGITALVSLDEAGISPEVARAHGLEHRHLPVSDFEPPTLGQADAFVAFVDDQLARGGQVAAHCQAGIGRTGTMLAAYLIAHGQSVDAATTEVRRRRSFSVESDSQLRFLEAYAAHRAR